jgi:glycosyltransferase involved in cell wall biosynthesis
MDSSSNGVRMNFPISVVIPTYQCANLIGETIESVLAQTLPASEVIVVDDGSTDDTERVCSQFSGKIKYKKIENGGVQLARNTGASLSSSPWLVFCDSDDLMQPDHLERIARLVVSCPQVSLVFCNMVFFGENVDGLWKTTSMFDMAPNGFWDIAKRRVGDEAWLIEESLASSILEAWDYDPFWMAYGISREYFDSVGGFDPGMCGIPAEDFEFMFRCLMGGGKMGLITRPTVRIRKHSGNHRGHGLRQVFGEIVIYGHAIRRNNLQSALLNKALDKACSRCTDAVNCAFASGQLEYVRALSRVVRKDKRYMSGKLRTKVAVASMPESLGRILNSILVRRRITDPSPIGPHLESNLYETIDFLSETAHLSE